jgi:hypothetical protein
MFYDFYFNAFRQVVGLNISKTEYDTQSTSPLPHYEAAFLSTSISRLEHPNLHAVVIYSSSSSSAAWTYFALMSFHCRC